MLNLVLLRLDFTNSIPDYKNILPRALHDHIIKVFPIAESNEVIMPYFQIQLNNAPNQQSQQQIISNREWHYFNVSREEHYCISENSMFYETQKYKNFNDFKEKFNFMLEKFKELKSEFVFSRLGFRYINSIEDILINDNFKINIPLELIPREKMCRNLSIVESNEDDFTLRVQHGYFNKDYPAKIVDWNFTLDIDAAKQGVIYYEDISPIMDKMHETIKNIYISFRKGEPTNEIE